MDLGQSVSCSVIHLRLENGDFSYLVIDDFAQRLAGVDMLLVACPVDSRLFVTQCPPAISSISSTCSVSGCPCGICWACSSAFDLIMSRSQVSLSLLPRHGISHLLKIHHFLLEMNGSSQMGSRFKMCLFLLEGHSIRSHSVDRVSRWDILWDFFCVFNKDPRSQFLQINSWSMGDIFYLSPFHICGPFLSQGDF